MSITGERAWAILGLTIVVYEIVSDEEQLLSVAVDRFIIKHPWITRISIALVALHLMNALPTKADPIHILAINANKAGVRTRTYKVQRSTLKAGRLHAIPHHVEVENG